MRLSSPSPRTTALLLLVALSAGCTLTLGSSAPWPRPSSPSAQALAAWSRYAPNVDEALYSYLPQTSYAVAAAAAASTSQAGYEDPQQAGSRFAAMTRNAARRAVESAGGLSALHYPAAPRVQLVAATPRRAVKTLQTQAHRHYTTAQASHSKLGRSPVDGGVQQQQPARDSRDASVPAAVADSSNAASSSSPRTFSKSSAMSFGWIALAAIVSSWTNFC